VIEKAKAGKDLYCLILMTLGMSMMVVTPMVLRP
jgi:hypothetical protein